MKKIILLAALVFSSFATIFPQAPAGYYDAAEGKKGAGLKSALHLIIKGHKEYPYSSSSTDTWDILKESDRDPENASNVILFYTGWSVNGEQEFNNGQGWNREHVWAKSRGDFGTSPGPGTDAHHLRPTDISVNAARENRWFDTCSVPYVDEGKPTGCYTDPVRWVWQPRDEVRGDVARMIFYMVTRYEGDNAEPDLEMIDFLPADNFTKDPVHAKLSALLSWHKEDTVDAFEYNRNNVIYGFQNNRNPFVDHPEYADMIWGPDTLPDPTGVYEPASFTAEAEVLLMYPNPLHRQATIVFPNPGNAVYQLIIRDMSGRTRRIINNLEGENISLLRGDLSPGIYFLELRGPVNYRSKFIIY